MKNLIVFLFLILVFSCKKKSEEAFPSTLQTSNLNTNCLINRISQTWDTSSSGSTICIYNSNNELIRLEGHNNQDQYSDSNFYSNFSYSNGKLSSFITNNQGGPLIGQEPTKEEVFYITEYTYQNNQLIENRFFSQSNIKPKTFLGSRKYFYQDNKLKYSLTDYDSIAYSQYINDRPGLVSYYLISKDLNGTKTYNNYQNQKKTYDANSNIIKVEETDTSKIFKIRSISEFDLSNPALDDFQFKDIGFYPNMFDKDKNFEIKTTVYSDYDCSNNRTKNSNAHVSTSKVLMDKGGKVLEIQKVYRADCPNPWKNNLRVSYQCK